MPNFHNRDRLAARSQAVRSWGRLVDEYLPVKDGDSPWRYSRYVQPHDSPQGWKLHVSATLLNAIGVFQACAPILRDRGVLFKSVATLDILNELNSGLRHGFSQVGKFITAYPAAAEDAVALAEALDRATAGFEGPQVPYDARLRPGSNVFYRYGAFHGDEETGPEGEPVLMVVRIDDGSPVPDRREYGHAVPDWAQSPFGPGPPARRLADTFVRWQVLPFELLSQRGKGGVYRAVDLSVTPARTCVLKEGRRLGELTWAGQDGRAMVEHEEIVLRELRHADVPVPEQYQGFDLDGHRYVTMEFVEGELLAKRLLSRRRKLPLGPAMTFAAQAAELVARIHSAGWVWRDCKPLNLVIAEDGRLRPLDFEGSVRIDQPTDSPYGTPAYVPPELITAFAPELPVSAYRPESNVPEDLHALGATIYHTLTSYLPRVDRGTFDFEAVARGGSHVRIPPLGQMRKGVPVSLRRLVAALMDPDPASRPSAADAAAALREHTDTDAVDVRALGRATIPRDRLTAQPPDRLPLEPVAA